MAFSPFSASHRLYFGLYSRIAKRLDIDPSYVSRVARGKRRSPKIESALKKELARIQRIIDGG